MISFHIGKLFIRFTTHKKAVGLLSPHMHSESFSSIISRLGFKGGEITVVTLNIIDFF